MKSSQSESFLETLQQYMAGPLDGASPLVAVRDDAGQVVALRSPREEYPVVNNVPCMIPSQAPGFAREVALWQKHQDEMWQDFEAKEKGVLSSRNETTEYIGEIIDQRGDGLFLDVGCGALPLPPYMAASVGHVRWMGIDPFFGDAVREFPFAQALGEYLPFRPGVFDGVLYASTIYHQVDPQQSLRRTRRVLKPDGRLYIWYEPPKSKLRYLLWRARRTLGWPCRYSRFHYGAFTHRSLHALLERTGFAVEEVVLLCTRCPDYGKCRAAGEFLAIAR